MTPAASSAYIDTWSRPIVIVGQGVLVSGIPLLSAAFAYYLTTENHSTKSVVGGFILGGRLVGGALIGVLGATVIEERLYDPSGSSVAGRFFFEWW